jgi:hypothetical protein
MPFLQDLLNQIVSALGVNFLNLLAALGILIVGWLVALIVAAIVRGILRRTTLDNRVAQIVRGGEPAGRVDVERVVGQVVFYLVMLFVLIAFFQTLQLPAVAEPLAALLNQVFVFLPRLLGAAGILLAAWVVASLVRFVILRAADLAKLDERLTRAAPPTGEQVSVSRSLATAAFWLIFLVFLPALLSTLGMDGLVAPVQGMFTEILAVVPNILAAAIILVVGWFIARIVQQIVVNLLVVAGADRLGERVGMTTAGGTTLSKFIGAVVYTLILIPAVIAALNTLQIEAISGPATQMLTTVLQAIPLIFGAALVLAVAYFVGRLVAGLVSNLLAGIGFNQLPHKLGLAGLAGEGQRPLSEIVGYVLMVAVMLFAAAEASRLLGFVVLTDLIAQFITLGGQILLGLVIFGIGLYLANAAHRVIVATGGSQANLTAWLVRVAILVLVGAMGLRQMGIANEIVNLAFGIMLGTLGVAAALAFGLGSRETAGRQVERWVHSVQSDSGENKPAA